MEIDAGNPNHRSLRRFLRRNQVLSLSTLSAGGELYTTPLFYAFCEKPLQFFMVSGHCSRHVADIYVNPQVSCCIYTQGRNIVSLQGIQATGFIQPAPDQNLAEKLFFRRFFYARPFFVREKNIFMRLDIEYLKFTDNSCGFGTKIICT
jgi:uncharacterized protein YhbP (UPF0306 family)